MDEIKNHPFIKTDRLILRQWNKNDFEPFARINADPKVQKYFPKLLTREESDHKILQFQKHIEKFGWGFWVVSLSENGECIGTVGLQNTPFQAHFVPAVYVGWRLAFEHWGKGYATEGALAVLRYGFETLRLDEIVSYTAVENTGSRRVMEKIGMHYNPKDDFNRPAYPEAHPLTRQVLYRLRRDEWKKQ